MLFFHSPLLEFKELKGLNESEKQTDFPFNGEREKMNVGLRPWVPKVCFIGVQPFFSETLPT